jgi:hypothetical protein
MMLLSPAAHVHRCGRHFIAVFRCSIRLAHFNAASAAAIEKDSLAFPPKHNKQILQPVDILSLLQRMCNEIKNKTLLDTCCSTDKF